MPVYGTVAFFMGEITMFQAIHYGNDALVDMARYLRRHDLVYHRPALCAYDGIPVGTGCAGGLVYHTEYGFEMTINHTDAIDFGPDGNMQAWAWEAEEHNTAPVSCGKVSIRSTLPIFDWVYLDKYTERLVLSDAYIEGSAITPFSRSKWKIYAPSDPGVIAFEFELDQTEEASLSIVLDKWPSPNFFHHYEQVLKIHDKNLSVVSSEIHGNYALIRQNLGRCNTTLAAFCEDGTAEILNSHTVELRVPKRKHHNIVLYLCANAGEGNDTSILSINAIEKAKNSRELWRNHCSYWRDYWKKSFVHLEQEDYLENLYYLHLYQMGVSSRGKYPLTFAGLWGWFRDSRNWGHFYHWNHQQNYWGLVNAGHPELCENYLEYRVKMLPQAMEDAKSIFGVEGAFYSDISNFNGYNAIEPDTIRNLSVGAQISLDLYKHYLYTQNEAFLREKAIPVMKACADFYLNMLEETEGELLLRGGSTAYESYWNLKKSITDQVMIRALLQALLDLGNKHDYELPLEVYRTTLEKLYTSQTIEVEHAGEILEIFSPGESWRGEIVRYAQGVYPLSPFPATLMAPVWPSGLISLAQRNNREFEIMRNTARVLLDKEVYELGALGCSGHSPAPEMAARLGMRDDMIPVLHKFVSAYQIFPNGLMHFADVSQNQQWSAVDRPRILEKTITSTQWEKLHEKSHGNRTEIEADWFLHCYFEAAANLFCGIQEMLLQSHGGIIRVFPALDEKQNAMFVLWGEGGYRITSECINGDIRYIEIFATSNGPCAIELPWDVPVALTCGKRITSYEISRGILTFQAEMDQTYLLFRREYPVENYYHNEFEYYINQQKKTLGRMSIGLDAYY